MSRGFHARTGATGGGCPHHCGRRGAMLAVALLVVALESMMVLPAVGSTAVDDYTSPVSYTHLTLPTSDLV